MRQSNWLLLAAIAIAVPACRPVDPPVVTPTVEPEVLACNITTPKTLSDINPSGIDYIVQCEVTTHATITIEPGTTILMKSGGAFAMGSPLVANGTADKPIIIKGETGAAGAWKSIYLDSGDNGNVLSYCQISGGGGGSVNGNADLNANVVVHNGTGANINNCVFEKSATNGIYGAGLTSKQQFLTFTNNQFNANVLAPIRTIPSNLNAIDNSNTFSGNAVNNIEIILGDITGANRWRKLGLPYYCTGNVVVAGTASSYLVVDAGVNIDFGTGSALQTKVYNTSYMRFEGTAAQPINLKGDVAAKGAWDGICFQSTSVQNSMTYVNISDAGGGAFTGASSILGNIVIGGSSAGRCSISNTSSSNSAGCGIRKGAIGNNVYDDGGGNTFSNNTGGTVCN